MTTSPTGWRIPAPHEVLGAGMIIAYSAEKVDLFAAGSFWAKLCSFLIVACALGGIGAARNYISPRLQQILAQRDQLLDEKTENKKEEPK